MSHTHALNDYRHSHVFLGEQHHRNERRTWLVVTLTAAMMVVEIAAGMLFGSMALLADGIHMATHAGALTVSGIAYLYARRHANDRRYTFGTGKVGDLAGFSSALVLALIALLIGIQSMERLVTPIAISFSDAIVVAVAGLAVNVLSAWLLTDKHGYHESHDGHRHQHTDHNLRSAYLHVLADALTSVLAITALIAGLYFGWVWMDPVMGIVGAVVIARWSWGLLRDTSQVLLDASGDSHLAGHVRELLEVGNDRLADLHLWRVGPGRFAMIASLVSDRPREVGHYKARLVSLPELAHVTIEVQPCMSTHMH
jgi:cation diffusion facilitator family transporter